MRCFFFRQFKIIKCCTCYYKLSLEKTGRCYTCLAEAFQYYLKYPQDTAVKLLMANCFRKIGDYESARIYMDKVDYDIAFVQEKYEFVVSSKISLLVREEKNQEVYDLLLEVKEKLRNKGLYVDLIEIYLKQRLGLPYEGINEVVDSYFCQQLKDYSVDRCAEHISKHFTEETNLYHLIQLVRTNKENVNSYHSSLCDEICYFKYDHIDEYSTGPKSTNILKSSIY